MKTMNSDKFDTLLYDSLTTTVDPSSELNADLKREIRMYGDKRILNVWYVPLFMAMILDLCIGVILYIFIPSILIKTVIFLLIVVSFLCILCITFTALKFELKKGSVIRI